MVSEVYWTELGAALHLVRQFSLRFDVQHIRFQGVTSGLIPGNIRVHTDVAEVSQEYIFSARKLRDRSRELLSATESVASRKQPEDLLRAFLKLPFSSSQVLFLS